MRLAPRLALTFGLLAAVSTAGVGLAVRTRFAQKETRRFQREVLGVCDRIADEVRRQGEADYALIAGACQNGELVQRVTIALDRGELDERRTGFSEIVRTQRKAFGLDELVVGASGGDLVGASPTTLVALGPREVDALLRGNTRTFTVRTSGLPALVSRCTKKSDGGRIVGMVGARQVDALLQRLARTLDVSVTSPWQAASAATSASTTEKSENALALAACRLSDDEGHALTFDVLKSTKELEANLDDLNRTLSLYAAVSAFVAFVVAIFLARSIGQPLSILAAEAGKVVGGDAQPLPLRARGSGEVRDLATAFDRMIQDLAVTRRRLAAASRVAAWREVAKRVAHEVKNPLMPIRAAVETLRRLRARGDPQFDEYFDEATRTVLGEVHRIANIVTEFTRFARLPEPRPQDVDAEEIARYVVQNHSSTTSDVALTYASQRRVPSLRADRDQVIQVLTNLVQNALESVRGSSGGAVSVSTDTDGHYAVFTVADNGPGIALEIASRLFEPYATTKASGTGLGLAIAQRIALEHNGELSYVGSSANGRGAVFRFLLPIEGPSKRSDAPAPDSVSK